MDVPDGLRYTDDHEWLRVDGTDGVVGITAYAADQLGDVFPKLGPFLLASLYVILDTPSHDTFRFWSKAPKGPASHLHLFSVTVDELILA